LPGTLVTKKKSFINLTTAEDGDNGNVHDDKQFDAQHRFP
jgi:hypothetical protein